jgi:predicted NAD/FAD-binding protein
MENQIDTNTLVVGHKVNVVRGQDQLPYECSYEVTFNGEDRVDLAMAGCSIASLSSAITLSTQTDLTLF